MSYVKYVDLKENPLFVAYLQEISTLQYYGKPIGSRPSKRGAGNELKFEDLRAIPLWEVSQLKQNVPGFFGLEQQLKN